MMWVACRLAIFGFLHSSGFTTPSQKEYDPTVHLIVKDLAVDKKSDPQLLRVVIKQSKTDPFRLGVTLFLGKTSSPICPVEPLLPYIAVRDGQPGPLFILEDGRMLVCQLFSTIMDDILDKLHLDREQFNTHSFRISVATSEKEVDITNSHIKMLDRWQSSVYQ